ncbi:hypothetical protein M9Y10_029550 [Tritrichomonas musculus]|uniref:Protein kinase domain-containing protein n=1 Tax=Tritrichomonas musculus TaxID=1915356 RepID=A0ABR2KML4_9EUKA
MQFLDTNLDLSNFEIEKTISSNLLFQVNQIHHKKDNIIYSIKSVKYDKNTMSDAIMGLCQYGNINIKLCHPSIIKYITYNPTGIDSEKPIIINEQLQNSLEKYIGHERIINNLKKFDDTQKLIILYGIAAGMEYLHSNDIIHCNLSLENIFLNKDSIPKISGFENSYQLSFKKNFSKLRGPIIYSAPEVLSNLEYSKSSDVFSFSILMFQILNDRKPFPENENQSELVFSIKNGEMPKNNANIPNSINQLIQKCWNRDPSQRPTFSDIVRLLREDTSLITSTVDIIKYKKYIKYIDESNISFDVTKRIFELEIYTRSYIRDYHWRALDVILFPAFDPNLNIKKYKINYTGINNLNLSSALIENIETKDMYSAIIQKHELKNFFKEEIINFYQKVDIISKLNHPAIIKFIGYSPFDFKGHPKPVILEEAITGTLFLEIEDSNPNSPWNDTAKLIYIYGIAAGMEYLHSHDIIHRDLKPENIYHNDDMFPKISGFDISKIIDKTKNTEYKEKIKGTPAYIAPEIYNKCEYSKSSDVYAFSLIMYEILTGHRPYYEFHSAKEISHEIINKGTRPSFDIPIGTSYRKLIERCWSQEPNERPTFSEIVQLLRTDSSFITDTIDETSYHEYIQYIDNYPVSFNSNIHVQELDDIMKFKIHTFPDIDIKINLYGIYQTEKYNLSLDFDFYNISNVYNQGPAVKASFWKISNFTEKRTNKKYCIKWPKAVIHYKYKHAFINFFRQLNILLQLDHPSILKFIGYSPVNIKKKKPVTAFVMEYAPNDTLRKILDSVKSQDPNEYWNDTAKLIDIYGIAAGMEYLHSHDIIHRDLKPENIYHNDDMFPKISGFDISKIIDKTKNTEYKEKIKGTPAYIAPEIYNKCEYSKSSDVYAFSLIMYEILTGHRPYYEFHSAKEISHEIINKGTRPSFDIPIGTSYRKLIERCWSQEPNERPTFSEIVQLLRTDSSFITDTIDETSYHEYIQYIDNYPVSFNPNQGINQLNDFLSIKSIGLPEFGDIVNIKDIYTTEANSISLTFDVINLNRFELKKTIHKGKKCKIFNIIEKEAGISYAAKSFPMEFNTLIISQIISVLSKLNHPSIIKFIGYSPINFKDKAKPMIVFDLAQNESLDKILEIERNGLKITDWDDTRKLICILGIAAGMLYLHSHNIIHCNLRPSNILLDEFLLPKITDFGYSKILSENSICCSIGYHSFQEGCFAPEIISSGQVSKASDVYDFSLVIYEILTGEKPYFNDHHKPHIITEKIPLSYRNLIQKCLSHEQEKRPIFDEIVNLLINDQAFITDKVDKELFGNYLEYINEYPISFIKEQNYMPKK